MADTHGITIQIKKVLDEYSEEVQQVANETAKAVAKEAVQKLRDTSPQKERNGGRYARGWHARSKSTGRIVNVIVHNTTDWQLTWLLEYGHDVVPSPTRAGKQSRVNGIKHIAPVEEWANKEFEDRIERELR